MNTKELRELSVDELGQRSREYRREILHARVQQAAGQLENTARLNHLRKDIARIHTVLSERRRAAEAARPPVVKPAPAPAPAKPAPVKAQKPAPAPAPAPVSAPVATKELASKTVKKRAAVKRAKPTSAE